MKNTGYIWPIWRPNWRLVEYHSNLTYDKCYSRQDCVTAFHSCPTAFIFTQFWKESLLRTFKHFCSLVVVDEPCMTVVMSSGSLGSSILSFFDWKRGKRKKCDVWAYMVQSHGFYVDIRYDYRTKVMDVI